jgi:hypothetical protein
MQRACRGAASIWQRCRCVSTGEFVLDFLDRQQNISWWLVAAALDGIASVAKAPEVLHKIAALP